MKYALALAAIAGLAAAAPGVKPRHRGVGTSPNPAIGGSRPVKGLHHGGSADSWSSNWSGSVAEGQGWTHVEGIVTVPQISGGDGAAVAIWVGIDGWACQGALWQTGFSMYTDGTIEGWWEWIPNMWTVFDGFGISVGDVIKMTIDATSTTTGTATLENQTTGQTVTENYSNPPSTLCETDAEWIIEAFSDANGNQVTMANFGSVTFSDAWASSPAGTVQASGGTNINLSVDNGNTFETSCGTNADTVTCSYTGP